MKGIIMAQTVELILNSIPEELIESTQQELQTMIVNKIGSSFYLSKEIE